MDDLAERLDVLLSQEQSSYKTVDYMDEDYQNVLMMSVSGSSGTSLFSSDMSLTNKNSRSSFSSSDASKIDPYWRERIAEWFYSVVDHFEFSREVVAVAIHYLDRYLATAPVTKKQFQLVAMTSLYLAIKLYQPKFLQISQMVGLSRGEFTFDEMTAMELHILRSLSWNVHPPTAYCFAKHFLFFMPHSSIDMDIRHDIFELSRFLTELSVLDYFFVSKKPSCLAIATLLNALEESEHVSKLARIDFEVHLCGLVNLEHASFEVVECRRRLKQLYLEFSRPASTNAETRNETISPVCVSYGFAGEYASVSLYGNATMRDGDCC